MSIGRNLRHKAGDAPNGEAELVPAAQGAAEPAPAPALRGSALAGRVRRARPSLVAACAEMDAAPEFAKNPDAHVEARVLRKLDIYRGWLRGNGFPPPMIGGRLHAPYVLKAIGHTGAEVTEPIRASVAALSDLLPEDGSALRSPGNGEVDLLIDAYATKMRERGHGLPRSGSTLRICWRTTAIEIGCEHSQMTGKRKMRLRALDALVGTPGPVVNPPGAHWDPTLRNAAVAPLLAIELERLRGRMPADPLHPHMIDVVAVAEGAGVTTRDLVGGPLAERNRADMEAARDGKRLVLHPLVAARRFTYSNLKEHGRKARVAEAKAAGIADPDAAGRATVAALTRFLTLANLGAVAGDVVPLDFPDRIRRAIALRPRFGGGWTSQMTKWAGYYDGLRSERPLPPVFATAIRILAAEVDVSASAIIKHVGHRALNWLNGFAYPTHESESHMEELEQLLRVHKGTLTKPLAREWRARRLEVSLKEHGLNGVSRKLPLSLSDLSKEEQLEVVRDTWKQHKRQETEFSRRLSHQIKDQYRLPFSAWPAAMIDAWRAHTPNIDDGSTYRAKKVGLRLPGARPTREERTNAKKEEERSWRPKTEKMGERLLGFYFGYLVRSRANGDDDIRTAAGAEAPMADGASASEPVFVPEPGLGMPVELVHPALFAVVDLLTGYAYWRRNRSGGRFAPTVTRTLQFAVEFLKPNTGLVWKNAHWLEHLEKVKDWLDAEGIELPGGSVMFDLEAFRENWRAAVQEAYELLCDDVTELRPNDPQRAKLRAPFIPIEGYLSEDDPAAPSDPMAKYMIGVREMLASKPLGMVDRHRHGRNCILTLILVQTGLRATTLLLKVDGPDRTLSREVLKDGKVRWRIIIPASRFKNWRSPYFSGGRPYDFVLDDEDGLYGLLDDYMAKGRPYLLNGRTSDALFITSKGKDYGAVQLSNTYRDLTGMFFVRDEEAGTGIEKVRPHGLHAVRHVIATSLLRTTGDLYIAAHAIQDTARTVEQHYVDFLPRDKVRLVVEHLRKSRAAPA